MVWTLPFEKYARQIGSLPQVGVKIENIWNHQLVLIWFNHKGFQAPVVNIPEDVEMRILAIKTHSLKNLFHGVRFPGNLPAPFEWAKVMSLWPGIHRFLPTVQNLKLLQARKLPENAAYSIGHWDIPDLMPPVVGVFTLFTENPGTSKIISLKGYLEALRYSLLHDCTQV